MERSLERSNTARSYASIAILTLIVILLFGCTNRRLEFNPGDAAPLFYGQTVTGEPLSLELLAGSPVLLHFWASWCVSCKDELSELNALSGDLGDLKLKIVTVSVDQDEKVLAQFIKAQGLTLPTIHDQSKTIAQDYRVTRFPESFLINSEGKLVLFPDPKGRSGMRITGPRPWSDRDMRKALAVALQ